MTRNKTRNRLTLIRKIRDNTPPPIDLRELKSLIAQLYHSDPRVLAQLDRIDLTGMGYEKSTSVRTKPNPTTGQNLSECLGWSDLEQIVGTLEPAQIWVLGCWVKRPLWCLSQRLLIGTLDPEQVALMPTITEDLQTDTIKALINKIYPYLT